MDEKHFLVFDAPYVHLKVWPLEVHQENETTLAFINLRVWAMEDQLKRTLMFKAFTLSDIKLKPIFSNSESLRPNERYNALK